MYLGVHFLLMGASAWAAQDLSAQEEFQKTSRLTGANFTPPEAQKFNLSETLIFMGPPLNNLSGETPAPPSPGAPNNVPPKGQPPAPGSGATGQNGQNGMMPGYSVHHVFAAGYNLSSTTNLGTALQATEPLTGMASGKFLVEDPEIRVLLRNLLPVPFFGGSTSPMSSAGMYLPISDFSRACHSLGGITLARIDRFQIPHSHFAMGSLLTLRSGLFSKPDGSGNLISSKVFGGVEGSYEASQSVEIFLMTNFITNIGPQAPLPDTTFTSQITMPQFNTGTTLELETGLRIRANPIFSFNPRLDWCFNQPIGSTTISLGIIAQLI